MITVSFQGKPFDITAIEVCTPTSTAAEPEAGWSYEDLQDLRELTHTHTKISFPSQGTGMQK